MPLVQRMILPNGNRTKVLGQIKMAWGTKQEEAVWSFLENKEGPIDLHIRCSKMKLERLTTIVDEGLHNAFDALVKDKEITSFSPTAKNGKTYIPKPGDIVHLPSGERIQWGNRAKAMAVRDYLLALSRITD